ncbi:MAG: FAD:protein FMN transferase [Phycisphaerae bacterium]|jgi:thiamine biosynthesis lipoprotein|nr:FAD:protein FMN transferase [Phycisphaerae bacterium]
MNAKTLKLIAGAYLAVALVGGTGCLPSAPEKEEPGPIKYNPIGIMGTETELTIIARDSQHDKAIAALRSAEQALREVEAKMSSWMEESELSQFNKAPAGKPAKLSETTMGLLRLSAQLAKQTDGAFDVTCRPILQIWRGAKKSKRLPADRQIAVAIGQCGWDKIELLADSASKKVDGAGIDLGGIAKGFGIDRAVKALEAAGLTGGMVNVGGDVRCFGQRGDGGKWRIGVRSPFDGDPTFAIIKLSAGAVCTSGNYERYFEIDSKRYSHIVDPRTGRPVSMAPSVTVVAPTATAADAWATALSVLGAAGLELIDENSGLEAMLVIGGPKEYRLVMTPGFAKLLHKSPVRSDAGATSNN